MGSRHRPVEHSQLYQQTLDDPSLVAALQNFYHLLSSCMGPRGRVKTIQNCIGGPLTLTSCSSRLLHSMSFSRPCLRLIVHGIQEHLNSHRDGGLLMGVMCLSLIKNALDIPNVGRNCVREVYEVLTNFVNDYVSSDECPLRVTVDTSNVRVMLAFIRGIIGTKSVCDLRGPSVQHISLLILKAFLSSVPEVPRTFCSDRIFVLQFYKKDVMVSSVMEGLLIEFTEMSALHGEQDLNIAYSTTAAGDAVIKVAVVSVSMSGDAEETLNAKYEGSFEVLQHAVDYTTEKMIAFCDWLVERKVGVLLCQKVIHPKIKSYLREKEIIFIDRMGFQLLAYVLDITDAVAITSVLSPCSEKNLGFVTGARHQIIFNKSYLHLQRMNSFVCTLILCAAWEEQLAELKCVSKSALESLYVVLKKPVLFCGGGCWQIHVASFIRHTVFEKAEEITSELQITRAQLLAAAESYAWSFEAMAHVLVPDIKNCWVDSKQSHLWYILHDNSSSEEMTSYSCACGLVVESNASDLNMQPLIDRCRIAQGSLHTAASVYYKGPLQVGEYCSVENLVLDSLDCVMSAVKTAVLMANTVLSITQFVHDA